MDWIESFLQNYGIWAMFVLIMLEYACFPVSSEIILPLAGGMGCRAGVVFSISCPFGNGSRTDWGTDSVWHWQVWRFSTVGTHYETLFFYGETNPNLLPCLWQSRKKCRSNQPCDSSVPHLYRLCRGCHGAEYQPLSFVFCHRHCYMEHGINRSWLLLLSIQRFVLSLF